MGRAHVNSTGYDVTESFFYVNHTDTFFIWKIDVNFTDTFFHLKKKVDSSNTIYFNLLKN